MADTAAREPGFYWVKRFDEWEVASWKYSSWLLTGLELTLEDFDFEEIGERVEKSS